MSPKKEKRKRYNCIARIIDLRVKINSTFHSHRQEIGNSICVTDMTTVPDIFYHFKNFFARVLGIIILREEEKQSYSWTSVDSCYLKE